MLSSGALKEITMVKAREALADTEHTNNDELASQDLEPIRKANTVVPKSKKRDDKLEGKSLTNRTSDGRFEAKY